MSLFFRLSRALNIGKALANIKFKPRLTVVNPMVPYPAKVRNNPKSARIEHFWTQRQTIERRSTINFTHSTAEKLAE